MNKKTYIFVVLVAIILVIIFLASRSTPTEEVSPTDTTDPVATVSTLSISNDTSQASAVQAGAKTIAWQTANYPTGAGVNINLIRKTSDSPREFAFVRTLMTDTPNDGQESWIPQDGENSDDLYIEVTCSDSYQFQSGCTLASDPIKVN